MVAVERNSISGHIVKVSFGGEFEVGNGKRESKGEP